MIKINPPQKKAWLDFCQTKWSRQSQMRLPCDEPKSRVMATIILWVATYILLEKECETKKFETKKKKKRDKKNYTEKKEWDQNTGDFGTMQVRPKLGEITKLTQSELRTESEFHAVNLKQPICYAQSCLKKRAASPKKIEK